jgi:hypothetical protein
VVETDVNTLAVGDGQLRITVQVAEGLGVWRTARAAFEAAKRCSEDYSSLPYKGSDDELSEARHGHDSRERKKGPSAADQIRALAYTLLADGEVHERTEIAKLAR